MFGGICKVHNILAYGMAIYCISSIYYMYKTQYIGTPFNDSLNEEQRKIKKKAVSQRKNIFYEGVILSFLILFLFKPFEKC